MSNKNNDKKNDKKPTYEELENKVTELREALATYEALNNDMDMQLATVKANAITLQETVIKLAIYIAEIINR